MLWLANVELAVNGLSAGTADDGIVAKAGGFTSIRSCASASTQHLPLPLTLPKQRDAL